MARSLIGLGANLGDRRQTLDQAASLIQATPGLRLISHSHWRSSRPIGGPPDQEEFLNGAALVETSLSPREVLVALRAIEQTLGRERREAWGPRKLDLDLLLYDDLVVDEPDLVIPHPRMATRRFVLEPMTEIAPDTRHPQIGWTIRQLLEHLDTTRDYVAIVGASGVGKTRLAEELAKRLSGRAILDPPGSSAPGGVAGRGGASEIEWIERRARQVAASAWRDAESPWISDFWLEQSLAYAILTNNASRQETARQALDRLPVQVVTPKLLILLESPTPPDQHGAALASEATRPGRGPWLRLSSADPAQALAHAAAAMEAMKP